MIEFEELYHARKERLPPPCPAQFLQIEMEGRKPYFKRKSKAGINHIDKYTA